MIGDRVRQGDLKNIIIGEISVQVREQNERYSFTLMAQLNLLKVEYQVCSTLTCRNDFKGVVKRLN